MRLMVSLFALLAAVSPAAAQELGRGTLAGGAEARLSLELAQDEAVQLEAMQDGIDLVLSIDGPGGRAEVDSPNGTKGAEPLLFIAAAAGHHDVRLRALEEAAPAGGYSVRVVWRRPARTADRQRIEAQELITRAYALRGELKLVEAYPLAERALALRARSMPGSVELADALSLRGYLRDEIGDYTGGGADFARAAAIYERALGAAAPATITTRINLAYLRLAEGRFDEAERLFREGIAARKGIGADPSSAIMGLGTLQRVRGQLDEAEASLREAMTLREAAGDADRAIGGRAAIGMVLVQRGRLDEGEPMCALAAEKLIGRPGFAPLTALSARLCVAEARLARGDHDAATTHVDAVIAAREQRLGVAHPAVAEGLLVKAKVQLATRDGAAARASLTRALGIWKKTWKRPHPKVTEARGLLAKT